MGQNMLVQSTSTVVKEVIDANANLQGSILS